MKKKELFEDKLIWSYFENNIKIHVIKKLNEQFQIRCRKNKIPLQESTQYYGHNLSGSIKLVALDFITNKIHRDNVTKILKGLYKEINKK